jgi:hypothetical protein
LKVILKHLQCSSVNSLIPVKMDEKQSTRDISELY